MTVEKKQFKEQMYETHPRIPDAYTAFIEGRISRREFIRFATLLGMSAVLATACTSSNSNSFLNSDGLEQNSAAEPIMQGIARGNTLTIGSEFELLAIDHPARLSWVGGSNIVRQVAEYLTLTNADNITVPYLLENWETNSDVSEWILTLREGIKFNNGDELTADDVIFNFSQWLDPATESSMLDLLSYLDGMNSVEKVDDYTIKLSLTSPNIGVPEHLFHYPAAIMHRSFSGDFIEQPIGTGPFTLTEYSKEERVVLTRRDDYWQMGEDGEPLPYLDQIIYVSIDKDAAVAGLQSGQIDSFYNPRPQDWQRLKDNPEIVIQSAATSHVLVLRARVDLEPWNDVRVLQALRKIQNREKILSVAYFGEGDFGTDAHVAPVHPAYDPRPVPEYDPSGARALLEEWAADTGNSLPIKASIATKDDAGEQEFAQILQEDGLEGGFEFELDITDASGYWARWTDVPLGISEWSHRPLDTMVLPLVYTANADGDPVAWN